jgi:hypothetical protein
VVVPCGRKPWRYSPHAFPPALRFLNPSTRAGTQIWKWMATRYDLRPSETLAACSRERQVRQPPRHTCASTPPAPAQPTTDTI